MSMIYSAVKIGANAVYSYFFPEPSKKRPNTDALEPNKKPKLENREVQVIDNSCEELSGDAFPKAHRLAVGGNLHRMVVARNFMRGRQARLATEPGANDPLHPRSYQIQERGVDLNLGVTTLTKAIARQNEFAEGDKVQ